MILLKSVYGARLTLRKLFADELTEWLLEAGFIYKSGFEFCGTQVSKVFIELAMFSSNPGKVHFEGSVHIFRYIRYNKTLGSKYYDDMNDAPVSDLSIQASIKTDNKLMAFSDSSWKYFSRHRQKYRSVHYILSRWAY